jgi:hypothetical protein
MPNATIGPFGGAELFLFPSGRLESEYRPADSGMGPFAPNMGFFPLSSLMDPLTDLCLSV